MLSWQIYTPMKSFKETHMVPCLPGSQLEKGKCDYDTNCNWFCSINIPRAQNICKALPLCMAPYEDMSRPPVPCIKYRQKKHYNQFYRNNKCSTFDWKTTVHLRSMWIKMTHFNCAQLTFHPNSFSCLVVPRSNVAHFSNPGRYLLPAPMGDGWSWGKFIRRLHYSFF